MHESSLARKLLAAALDAASRERAIRIERIRGWVAETESLSAERVTFHLAALAVGTVAEGARFELDIRRVEARCHACEATYQPEHHLLLCPVCGHAGADLLGETGVGVDAIDAVVLGSP
jgi:hydrogenase nickel incorporation protein HypA/HybF